MKKLSLLLLSLVAFLPGCMGSKKEKMEKSTTNNKTHMTKVDIPMADEGIKSFFDEDIQEFTLAEEDTSENAPVKDEAMDLAAGDQDFSWVEESTTEDDLQVAYFDFDSATIKPEQGEKIDQNAQLIKEKLAQAKKEGKEATVNVQGHACHSAGSVAEATAPRIQFGRGQAKLPLRLCPRARYPCQGPRIR